MVRAGLTGGSRIQASALTPQCYTVNEAREGHDSCETGPAVGRATLNARLVCRETRPRSSRL